MTATVRPETSFDDAILVPERVGRGDTRTARRLLERDGAVILTGWTREPDSLIAAAADALGTRLRELERVRTKTTQDGAGQGLHRDRSNVVVDIGDRRVQLRDSDIDYLLILCAQSAPAGGGSMVVDGYRLVNRLRYAAPRLYEFLTTVDVNVMARNPSPDVHPVPGCPGSSNGPVVVG